MPDDVLKIMPIRRAWVATDPATSAQNYDEFQSDSEVTEIIKANPKSILRIDLPYCDPSLADQHLSLAATLGHAKAWLAEMKQQGLFKLSTDVVFIYEIEIKARPERSQIGLECMLSPDDIWDISDNPRGKIIRNEEIFIEKAQGRADLIQAIKHIIGTVNLSAADPATKLEGLLRETARRHGEPAIASPDHKGNVHRVWAIDDPSEIAALREAFKTEEVVVADGNHRSKAAQLAGLDAFLGVIFCAQTMNIDPYNRMIKDLGLSADSFIRGIQESGFAVERLSPSRPFQPALPDEVGLYLEGEWWRLVARNVDTGDPIESLAAKLIENRIVKKILGFDPADKRVSYVGGDYDLSFLQAEVDSGRQQCAFSLPAVTMEQFFKVNDSRQPMPRKTTWFSPKIRSGIVMAELEPH